MTHASVFSGIGGPEVAATMLGWDNLFHCEINPFGRAVLDYWYPNSASYEDITNTDFSEWRGKVDVLTGGFPCQPFSYAGQRRGAQDDRYLWPYMFRCIDQVQPTWVVAENVAGIQTMVEQGEVSAMATQGALFDEVDAVRRYQLRETFTLERICSDLERHGYEVQPVLIPACAVGAPHRRDRVFIVARRIATDTANDRLQHDAIGGSQAEDDRQASRRNTELHIPTATDGSGRTAANPDNTRLEGRDQSGCKERGQRLHLWRHFAGHGDEGSEEGVCGERWQNFPSVSPVHRGNDGIPFNVDSLTISFGKWRTEALKAYGNAIVPQVMYEIFRAIEIAESI